MADTKTTALPEETSPITTDLLKIVDDPGGTPISKRSTIANVLAVYNSIISTLTNKTIDWGANTITFTSAEAITACSDETGTGALVFANSPTLVTPVLGTPASGTLTNTTGLPAAGVVGTAAVLGANTFTGDQNLGEKDILQVAGLLFKDFAELTISSGVVAKSQTLHIIDTESDDATDDITAITKQSSNDDWCVCGSFSAARDPTFKDGGGSSSTFAMAGGDFTCTSPADKVEFVSMGSSGWGELSRSDNA